MRQLSIPQASADIQGGLMHCPDPPPSQHRNAGHGKTGVSLHGQGKRAAPFGASAWQGLNAIC